MAAGFRGPLFLLGLSTTVAVTQTGFRGALPLPFLGARGTIQAGFRCPLPIPFLGARFTENVYEPEGGPSDGDYLLHEDDEVIMLIARAFLTMVN